MTDITATSLPNAAAIAFLRHKQQITTAHWDEMLGETHAKAFTVAGATKAALLNDLHQAVGNAIADGQSIGEFRNAFDKIVAEHGWTYKGKRGWRTRVIYDTNMRAANQAAKWSRIQETKALRPYLEYRTAGDNRVRKQHADWDGTVLPVDDPWWSTHYPANDYGCRCGVRSLSQREVDARGLKISAAPTVKLVERINVKTGEVYAPTPEGIGVGFDYNVGQAWLAEDDLGRIMMKSPPAIQRQLASSSTQLSKALQGQFETHSKQLQDDIEPARKQIAIGYHHPTVLRSMPDLPSATITMDNHTLRALQQLAKQPSSTLPVEHIDIDNLNNLPSLLQAPEQIYKLPDDTLIYAIQTKARSDAPLTYIAITPAASQAAAVLATNAVKILTMEQYEVMMSADTETLINEQ